MKDKMKLSKMEKYALREYKMEMETVTRFLNEEVYSMFMGTEDTFAAVVFADTWDRCFMIIEVRTKKVIRCRFRK